MSTVSSSAPRSEARSEQPASNIVLGLNCGGSDSFSGITANPALGYCCDLIVEQGGTVVLRRPQKFSVRSIFWRPRREMMR